MIDLYWIPIIALFIAVIPVVIVIIGLLCRAFVWIVSELFSGWIKLMIKSIRFIFSK